jgi:hypothetical protein
MKVASAAEMQSPVGFSSRNKISSNTRKVLFIFK